MLDIPGQLPLDKARIVGECVRLGLRCDAERMRREVGDLPVEVWGSSGGRIGVHRNTEALFLRGFAPAEGEKPIEDRPVFDRLPYLRSVVETLIDAPRLRCLLARMPAATSIPAHVDRAPYFAKTLRIHVPVESNPAVFMLSGKSAYVMLPGEIWVLNNSSLHGVVNADPIRARTHLICDYLPSEPLLELLRLGERGLGFPQEDLAKRCGRSELRATTAN
ncbi:MAG: aspartyl/asparaginyl beta-hydroxylase domain-containing protein [Pseudomonadota bacterium]|nr:aspartyl/asparaginyl beta-hydroxylase domain-containing protein [Pseudomonadota bacterium]